MSNHTEVLTNARESCAFGFEPTIALAKDGWTITYRPVRGEREREVLGTFGVELRYVADPGGELHYTWSGTGYGRNVLEALDQALEDVLNQMAAEDVMP